MTTMTRVQAEALAAFITRLRTDWRPAGIVAALEKAAPGADAYDVARALINLAAEPSVQTPGLLPGPGPHWRNPDGTTTARRGDHDVRCPEHPINFHPCPLCKAKRQPPPPDYLEAKAAALAARPRAATHAKPPQLTDVESAAKARARLEKQHGSKTS